MGKERQLRKQEETKNAILDVARNIISQEGLQGLSIRKITNVMEYSPGIIYHYFKDKNEIIESLVGEGYQRIITSISSVERNDNEPDREIKEMFFRYIEAALADPEIYKAFMLNDDLSVTKRTSLLAKGISQKSPTMQVLNENIKRGIQQGRYAPLDSELTAQIIWTSAFGLIIKIIFEKDLSQEQVNRLIEHHFTVLFNGIIARKEV